MRRRRRRRRGRRRRRRRRRRREGEFKGQEWASSSSSGPSAQSLLADCKSVTTSSSRATAACLTTKLKSKCERKLGIKGM
jgi:hypothetical protein